MKSISVKRYENPKSVGWAGYIEPEDKSWIAFIGLDGRPRVYLSRDTETGAVLPDDPTEQAEALDRIRRGWAQADGFPGGPSRKPPID